MIDKGYFDDNEYGQRAKNHSISIDYSAMNLK